jgi:copper chaperone CopZ
MGMEKKNLNITGMTCAACARAIEKALDKTEGIRQASVNLATEKLTVEYDDEKFFYSMFPMIRSKIPFFFHTYPIWGGVIFSLYTLFLICKAFFMKTKSRNTR